MENTSNISEEHEDFIFRDEGVGFFLKAEMCKVYLNKS